MTRRGSGFGDGEADAAGADLAGAARRGRAPELRDEAEDDRVQHDEADAHGRRGQVVGDKGLIGEQTEEDGGFNHGRWWVGLIEKRAIAGHERRALTVCIQHLPEVGSGHAKTARGLCVAAWRGG